MKSTIKTIVLYALVIGVVVILAAYLISGMAQASKISYDKIIDMIYHNEVESFTVSNKGVITLKTVKGETFSRKLFSIEIFLKDIDGYMKARLDTPESSRVLKSYDIEEPQQTSWIIYILPSLIIVVVVVALYFLFINRAEGGSKMHNFGKARARVAGDGKDAVHFSDVAGADEEKEELVEIVEYLKNPQKFVHLGARIPRGVLLVGPPGTGKTLLAKAVAGEAGVPFLSISGSDFMEMYVGVGASRVRDLFETAKKAPASIIFIDEIDAIGRHRGSGLGGGHDEREQTLNQLLVEMDGFNTHDGVIVMAATNRPDILDPALLRPGRFDRQITVNYPDMKGREDILHVHAKGKPFEDEVDFHRIAQRTVGFTGADLANLLNEAALLAARKGKSLIGMIDIDEAMIKVSYGTQKKKANIKESEKRKTAYHEAGHAIVSYILPTQDPVRQISIIPVGRALGYTTIVPEEDRYSVYKNQLKEQIAVFLGGRAAEEVVFGDISGGASNDIQRATNIARNMVTKLGMSDVIGNINLGSEHSDDEVFLGRDFYSSKNYSEETAALIDAEIKKIIDNAYAQALEIIRENRDKLDFIVEFLIKHDVMDGDEFEMAMKGSSMEEIEEMGAERRKKSEEENALREKHLKEEREREEAERKKREEAERAQNDGARRQNDAPRFPWEQ